MFEVSLYYFLGSCSFDLFKKWLDGEGNQWFWHSLVFNLIGFVSWLKFRQIDRDEWRKEFSKKEKSDGNTF